MVSAVAAIRPRVEMAIKRRNEMEERPASGHTASQGMTGMAKTRNSHRSPPAPPPANTPV
jgi:hypothetical protein